MSQEPRTRSRQHNGLVINLSLGVQNAPVYKTDDLQIGVGELQECTISK